MKKYIALALIAFVGINCSSKSSESDQPKPAWVDGASRVVDNGYIVYVGQGEDTTLERAQFKAEGMALQDLANECSFTPKGTRVEDHFVDKQKYTYKAYAKVGIELQECDEAKKALEPETIKSLANVPFTEQVKKYQDLVENGEVAQNNDNTQQLQIQDVSQPSQSESHVYIASAPMFYGYRQYVVYQKQEVIMAPPGAYPPQSPQSQAFVSRMTPVSNQLQTYEATNPAVRSANSGYSAVANKPVVARPQSLRGAGAMARPRPIAPPGQRPHVNQGQPKSPNPGAPRRGRRRGRGWGND